MSELNGKNAMGVKGRRPIVRWRAAGLLTIVLTQAACGGATTAPSTSVGAGAADPAYSAADEAAKLRLQEEYRRIYPGVDVTDDYALAKTLFEDSKRDDPTLLDDTPFPERLIWEANSGEPSVNTILAARQAGIAAAKAALSPMSPERVAQAQARLLDHSMPWAAISESGQHDMLNLASVAPYACAIDRMQFWVNGGPTETQEFSSCEGGDSMAAPPHWIFDLKSIKTVSVTIIFTDRSRQTRDYPRHEIFWR